MLTIVNGSGIEVCDALRAHARGTLIGTLGHRTDRLTRVEVQLSDHNGTRGGPNDKRCLLEARPESLDPFVVSADGGDLYELIEDAAGKLARALDTAFGRSASR